MPPSDSGWSGEISLDVQWVHAIAPAANIILVEADDGDVNRVMGAGNHPQLTGTTLNLLRNKRSVELDLKTPEGRRHLEEIVRTCDVVVTTMRPSALAKLGVTYEDLSRVRPDLVYCQAQGFLLSGPRADDPAYDDIIQAGSGLAGTRGGRNGR